jgi:hypothetical protein
LNRGSGLWSFITKCKEHLVKQNPNGNKEKKPSELAESLVVPYNLGDKHIMSEVRTVECAGVPAYNVLQNVQCKSENIPQGRHDSNMAPHKAVELETSVVKDQLFLYVFSPGADSWEMEQLETVSCGHVSIPVSQLSCLAQSLTEVRISK